MGPSTQTTKSTTEVPQYVQDAQQNLLGTAKRFTDPFLNNPPANTVADFNPNQRFGFDIASILARNALVATPLDVPVAQPHSNTYANLLGSNAAGQASTAANLIGQSPAGDARTVDVGAGQVGGDAIRALLNPYTKDVLDPTIELMRRELGKTQAGIGARDASSAAFGGSRGALQSSEANRAFGDQVALTTAQLMKSGYDQATATALANAQARQQAGEYNASATNDMSKYNAGLFSQATLADTQARNDMAKYNAGLYGQALGADTAAANTMAENNANRRLTGTNLQNTFLNDEQQRQLKSLQSLLGAGGQQYQGEQAVAQQPIDMLKLLMQATPGQTGSTTTTQQPTQSNIGSTLGGLASIFGLFLP